jgi:hypothetical protein
MSAGLVKKMTDKMFDCMWLHHWRFGGDEMLTHCAATATSSAPDKVFTDITGLHRTFSHGERWPITDIRSQRSISLVTALASSNRVFPSSPCITTLDGWRSSRCGIAQTV